jgi:hypothetical protein
MSVKNDTSFDIRTRVSRSRNEPAEVDGLYDQINFMTALLKGINYRVVYGDLAKLLPKIITNLKQMTLAPGELDAALAILEPLQAKLATRPAPVLVRSLWEKQYPASSFEARQVVAAFRALEALRPGVLCFPFLAVQDGWAAPVGKLDMDEHVDMLKNRTLEQLFRWSKKKNKNLALAVFKARRLGILSREAPFRPNPPAGKDGKKPQVRKIRYGMMGGGGTNYKKCGPNHTCETTVEPSFCSAGDDGDCSVISD